LVTQRFVPCLLVLCALALAACGSGGRSTGSTAGSTAAGAPAVRSAEHDAREAQSAKDQATTPDGRKLPIEPQDTEPNKGTPGVQDSSGGKIDVPIRNGSFTPHVMRLKVGQIVVFTNDDDELHAVWADHLDQPHSGAIPVRGRYEFEPLKPGRVDYHDPLHPQTTGVLVVSGRTSAAAGPSAFSRPARPNERPTPCGEVAASARHELGDPEGDMARDTHCTRTR
jgi:plastocyanin